MLFKEFGIMNCFTLEASFHGFIDKDRKTAELTTDALEDMGLNLGIGMADYNDMVEEDSRYKALIKEQLKRKKRNIKARDIARAIFRSEKQVIAQSQEAEETDVDV